MDDENKCLEIVSDALHAVSARSRLYILDLYFVLKQIVEFVRRELARSAINAMLRVIYRDRDVWFAVAPRDIADIVCLYVAGDGTFCGYRHDFGPPRPHPSRETVYHGHVLPDSGMPSFYPHYEYGVMSSSVPMITDNGPGWRREWVVAGRVLREQLYTEKQYIDASYCNGYTHGVSHGYHGRNTSAPHTIYNSHGRRLAIERGNPPVVSYMPMLGGESVSVPGPYDIAVMRRVCYPFKLIPRQIQMSTELECVNIFAAELHRRLAGDKFKDQIKSVGKQIVDLVQRELARTTIDGMLSVMYSDPAVWFAAVPRDIVNTVRDWLGAGGMFCGYPHDFGPPSPTLTGYAAHFKYGVRDCAAGPIVYDDRCSVQKYWCESGRFSRQMVSDFSMDSDYRFAGGYLHGVCAKQYSNNSTGEIREHYVRGRLIAREVNSHDRVYYFTMDGKEIGESGAFDAAAARRICYNVNGAAV